MTPHSAAYTFPSGSVRLAAHVAHPAWPASSPPPGLVLCHGLPAGPGGGPPGQTYPQLADRITAEAGWLVLTFSFRGTGESGGEISLAGWREDLRAAVDHLVGTQEVSGVWLAGSSAGGALAICVAADDDRVRGVATLAAPAEMDISGLTPVQAIGKVSPRAVLLLHGTDDEVVAPGDARALAEAGGGASELVVLNHAGHRLRHDPRAVAVLMGWLDRQVQG